MIEKKAEVVSLLGRLRTITTGHHRAVENITILKRLVNVEVDLSEYSHILLTWHWVISVVFYQTARIVETDRMPLIWLERDLALLNRLGMLTQVTTDVPIKIASVPQALGYLYVLYGSQLGNCVIYKRLTNCRQCISWPRYYFHGYGEKTRQNWLKFTRRLESVSTNGAEAEVTVASALLAFEQIHRAFSNLSQLENP